MKLSCIVCSIERSEPRPSADQNKPPMDFVVFRVMSEGYSRIGITVAKDTFKMDDEVVMTIEHKK